MSPTSASSATPAMSPIPTMSPLPATSPIRAQPCDDAMPGTDVANADSRSVEALRTAGVRIRGVEELCLLYTSDAADDM
eukprot:2891800-Rhodomonas_salina.2